MQIKANQKQLKVQQMTITSIKVFFTLLVCTFLLHSVQAEDFPRRILGGKPVESNPTSGRFYNQNGAAYGTAKTQGRSTRLYDQSGKSVGRIESSKNQNRFYSGNGTLTGRSQVQGNNTRFYDSSGKSDGKSTTSGTTTRFYNANGSYAGKSESFGSSTRYFDASGKSVGSKK